MVYDICVIGGGINGVGVAREAVLRGLSVCLLEKDDLASHTSQWSSKLIHGGLRYLEHYAFGLVAASLAERERLLKIAPHLIKPLAFLIPHETHMRPKWLLRAGLFLYDHLSLTKGVAMSLPKSYAVNIGEDWGLLNKFQQGFVYSDAQVDDARLVVTTAKSAAKEGATILTRSAFVSAQRQQDHWLIQQQHGELKARHVVNTTGPWVAEVAHSFGLEAKIKHVQGSHIIVPKLHARPEAMLLQNADGRIVFVMPYQEQYSLIGTTDNPVSEYHAPKISEQEIEYLLDLVNAYIAKPLRRSDIIHSYSGVRPLYDEGNKQAQALSRDFVIKQAEYSTHLFGGKITTYRESSEQLLDSLSAHFPHLGKSRSAEQVLLGGAYTAKELTLKTAQWAQQYGLPLEEIKQIAARQGSDTEQFIANDRGACYAPGLYEKELRHMYSHEWARSAEDVLWRRSKIGLQLQAEEKDNPGQKEQFSQAIQQYLEAQA
ncbi:MAG: hypothetical protein RLZZ502_1104 [Pseudomonadota bacterium]|jgi:glycerol-3-phosphate dehydrogenase